MRLALTARTARRIQDAWRSYTINGDRRSDGTVTAKGPSFGPRMERERHRSRTNRSLERRHYRAGPYVGNCQVGSGHSRLGQLAGPKPMITTRLTSAFRCEHVDSMTSWLAAGPAPSVRFSLPLPAFKDETRRALSVPSRTSVPFTRGHDRSLHQHMPRLCKLFRFLQFCLLCEATHDSADLRKMDGRSAADRAVSL
jgi:hypothetical protein